MDDINEPLAVITALSIGALIISLAYNSPAFVLVLIGIIAMLTAFAAGFDFDTYNRQLKRRAETYDTPYLDTGNHLQYLSQSYEAKQTAIEMAHEKAAFYLDDPETIRLLDDLDAIGVRTQGLRGLSSGEIMASLSKREIATLNEMKGFLK